MIQSFCQLADIQRMKIRQKYLDNVLSQILIEGMPLEIGHGKIFHTL